MSVPLRVVLEDHQTQVEYDLNRAQEEMPVLPYDVWLRRVKL